MSLRTFLENYWSRDQLCRTIQYGAQFLSGVSGVVVKSGRATKHCLTISESIGNMRVVNRFFDDVLNLVGIFKALKKLKVSRHFT